MKIRMMKDVDIEVVEDISSEFQTFERDEIITGDLLEDYPNMIDLELQEGGFIYGLSKADFIIIQP